MATSLRGKKRRDAEQDRRVSKAKQLLANRKLELLYMLGARRKKMSEERRDCGNDTEGRVCAKCRRPKPALRVDETVDQLVQIGKFRTGFKEDYTNFPINNFYIPMVERCGCPFFVVNEFLYQCFSSGIDIKYFLLNDYRLATSKLAKELRRSIDALRGSLDGTRDSLLQIEMLSWAGVMPNPEPIWSVMKAVNEIAQLLPEVQAAAKYRAGPAGDLIRRSIFLSMAMAWEELTGRLPAKNNAKFQDLANAAYWTVVPNGDENYDAEVAAATAIEALKRSKKAAANRQGATITQRWLPKPWVPKPSFGS